MNRVIVRGRLSAPIPDFPEFASMVGKNVEITICEHDPDAIIKPAYDFWNGPSAAALAVEQGINPAASLEQLQPADDFSDAFDGFEEALQEWRKEPWRNGEAG